MDLLDVTPSRYRTKVLDRRFQQLGPWVTRVAVGGREDGGEHSFADDVRLTQFWQAFPSARRILELGALEGGHTFELARRPGVEQVIAVEGRKANLARARFAQRVLDVPNVVFTEADLETWDPSSFGTYDAIFCCGLLYHLPRPWKLVDRLRPA